ncbi:MAG: hypothetical protein ACLGHQ_07185 [Acidimicrobiia bacterium]
MGRVLLVLVGAVPVFALGTWAGAWWSTRAGSGRPLPSDRELDFQERMATLQHHTDLLERARRAALDGEPGLANIYAEAAERVLSLTDDPQQRRDEP